VAAGRERVWARAAATPGRRGRDLLVRRAAKPPTQTATWNSHLRRCGAGLESALPGLAVLPVIHHRNCLDSLGAAGLPFFGLWSDLARQGTPAILTIGISVKSYLATEIKLTRASYPRTQARRRAAPASCASARAA